MQSETAPISQRRINRPAQSNEQEVMSNAIVNFSYETTVAVILSILYALSK